MTVSLADFAGDIASGALRIVDLTQTLSPDFPPLVLPPEFGQVWAFKQETIPFVNSLQEQQAAVSEKLAEVDKLAATVTKKVEVINSFEARLAAAEEAAAKATKAAANTTKPAAPAKTGIRGFVDQYGLVVAQAVLMVTTVGTVIYSNRSSNAGSATGEIPGI